MIFEENFFLRYILLTDQISLSDWQNICIVIVCFPGCDIINFEIKCNLMVPFSQMAEKFRAKI